MMAPRAEDQFLNLDAALQDRVISKLDAVVSSEWREPREYLEPLTGSPFDKFRVGDYRIVKGDHVPRVE